METKYTPGPWFPEYGEDIWIRDEDGNHIATVHTDILDARLIAAAPVLLEALKGLLAGPNWPGAQMTARNAIAKVESLEG
jgi:hypothetical protein